MNLRISQTLLSIEEHILFMKIVNTKLPLLRPGLESNILHLINAMSGIMKKLMLMEWIKPSVNLTGKDPSPMYQ